MASNGGLLSGLETAIADWEGVLASLPFLILAIIVVLVWVHLGRAK